MKNARSPEPGAGANRNVGRCKASSFYRTATAPVTTFLSHLASVRETGPGRWIAKCPSHDDRNPSLSVRECSDGTLLLNCFSSCSAGEIVAAVGLELRDLFPPSDHHYSPPKTNFERRRYGQALDALRALAHESLIILVAAENLAAGEALSDEDLERLRLAEQRIRAAREIAA